MQPMTIEEIKNYLPHRYPFLLLDRIVDWEANKRIVALKNVTANEPFFQGHFPNFAVMPGVLVIEAMAQACAMLGLLSLGQKDDGKSIYYFVGIDGARFKRPVVPGDQLILEVWQERVKAGIHKYRTLGTVDGQVAAECTIMCTERQV
jgi:3-hydroxyacyl-[acyl-carrier-protein] dehydratase